MKRLIALISLSILVLLFSGCETSPKAPLQPIVDRTLPQIGGIKFLADMTDIGFEWKPNRNERVIGYHIYRANATLQESKLKMVATIKDKYASHYVDTNLEPQTKYIYRFTSYTSDKRESPASKMIYVSTIPAIEPISFIQAITGLPHRVKLIWRPHPSQKVESYIVERNKFSSKKWDKLAEVKGRLNAEYIDAGLKENSVFRYRVVVKTYEGLLSKPSKIVEAGTKPLPNEIEGLKASTNIPKKIVLNWSPSTRKDFSYYKVYRAINPLLFYTYLAKTKDITYEDLINSNGSSYYYYVTIVDKDGLESLRQKNAIAGSTLAIPSQVYITSATNDGQNIYIAWGSKDNRSVKYNIIKEYSLKGISKKETITGITSKSFHDTNVIKGTEYSYKIIAIDKYGLASEESQSAIIKIPKG